MSGNGRPHIEVMDLPLCLVCEKPFTKGQRVVVSHPELIFIHLDCVESEDEARELLKRDRETGGE